MFDTTQRALWRALECPPRGSENAHKGSQNLEEREERRAKARAGAKESAKSAAKEKVGIRRLVSESWEAKSAAKGRDPSIGLMSPDVLCPHRNLTPASVAVRVQGNSA